MFKLALVLALVLSSASAEAQASASDLSDDSVLNGAVVEVRAMNLRELEVVVEYVAACIEPLTSERNYHCGRQFTISSIKISAAPQFAKLSRAVFSAELRSAASRDKDSFGGIGVHLAELRRSTIFLALRDAARDRYQELVR